MSPQWLFETLRILAFRRHPLRQNNSTLSFAWRLGHFLHHLVQVEAGWLLPRWKFFKGGKPLRSGSLSGDDEEHPLRKVAAVQGTLRTTLEWIGTQVVEHWRAESRELALPRTTGKFRTDLPVLLHERDLPVSLSDRHQIAVVRPIEE